MISMSSSSKLFPEPLALLLAAQKSGLKHKIANPKHNPAKIKSIIIPLSIYLQIYPNRIPIIHRSESIAATHNNVPAQPPFPPPLEFPPRDPELPLLDVVLLNA